MRRIAIIGSGVTGLVAAHALRRAGVEVTLYSDRTAQQWLTESRPTGTAGRFPTTLAIERDLRLDHWDDVAPRGEGVALTFCPTAHHPLIRLNGRGTFQAIDVRLQSARWMCDLEDIGGRIVIEPVSVASLDAISAAHDLTIVAAGRGDLCKLFPRDEERCVYDKPRRNLAMVVAKANGPLAFDDLPFLPVRFEFLGTDGEVFLVPYFHKDHGPSWNLLFEAQPGSRIDRFGSARNGEEALAIAKQIVCELFPWNARWIRDLQLADEHGWLAGSVTPAVRKPVATLPSGRIVAALGDTAIQYDPISAQGANSGIRQARHLVDAIVAHEGPLDARFLTETFDDFYRAHARYACLFSNIFLEPITPAAKEILIAQYGSDGVGDNARQRIADAFFANFDDPSFMTDALLDVDLARRFIAATTRAPWLWSAVRGRAAVARDQLRLARHPLPLAGEGRRAAPGEGLLLH